MTESYLPTHTESKCTENREKLLKIRIKTKESSAIAQTYWWRHKMMTSGPADIRATKSNIFSAASSDQTWVMSCDCVSLCDRHLLNLKSEYSHANWVSFLLIYFCLNCNWQPIRSSLFVFSGVSPLETETNLDGTAKFIDVSLFLSLFSHASRPLLLCSP